MKISKRQKRIIVKSFFNSIFIACLVYVIFSFGPFIKYEVYYRLFLLEGKKYAINLQNGEVHTSWLSNIFSSDRTIYIKPVNENFDIIIPQIGLNEKIISINANDPNQVVDALRVGVGRAEGTAYPNQYGNMYLFAHSSTSVLSIDRYNSVFTLLRDLNIGDKVYIFYQGKQYTYQIYKREIVSQNDTKDMTFKSPFPQITLQTCDPPGFDINRLLLFARNIKS